SRPNLELHEFEAWQPVRIAGFELLPIEVPHGDQRVFGFRAGALGYITDAKRLDSRAIEALRGVRVLVLNALWRGNPHPTQCRAAERADAARTVGAAQSFLARLAHRGGRGGLAASLPAGTSPAHGGRVVDVPEG